VYKVKIAIFAINSSFFQPIRNELITHHSVREFQHTNNPTFDLANVMRLIDWCDLAYFEFAQYPLNVVSNLACVEKPLVVRGHGIELFEPEQVNWEKVDLLIVTPICKRIFLDQNPKVVPEIRELPIGCDPDLFTFSPKKEKKAFGKNIVLQSTIMRPKKRIYTSIQTFGEIYKQDPEFRLYICGNWKGGFKEGTLSLQDEYNWPVKQLVDILGLDRAIALVEFMPKMAWRDFLQDKDLFWSNSIMEGFHVALAEGMSTGMYPIINCWWGANLFYNEEWICKSQSEMVETILTWAVLEPEGKLKLAREAREWILKFDEKVIAKEIRDSIERVYETRS